MNRQTSTFLMLASSFSLVLFSCQKETVSSPQNTFSEVVTKTDQSQKFNTFKGPEVKMGNGKARSWIVISHTGVPQEIGIELTSGALSGLPTNAPEGEEISFKIPLHKKATEVTPFDHIEIDWNPFGHPPPGVYDVPHFDFHFYKISLDEQLAIPAYSPATANLFDSPLAPGLLPAIYVPIPGGVEKMGKHWFNPLSPEWQGSPFTSTFIYGTFNGDVIFYEPMITMALLQSGITTNLNIPQPAVFSPSNTYYPTTYNIYSDPSTHDHYISLSNFVYH